MALKKCKVCGAFNIETATNCVACGASLVDIKAINSANIESTPIYEKETKKEAKPESQATSDVQENVQVENQENKNVVENDLKDNSGNKHKKLYKKPHLDKKEKKPRKQFEGIGYVPAILIGIATGLILVMLL